MPSKDYNVSTGTNIAYRPKAIFVWERQPLDYRRVPFEVFNGLEVYSMPLEICIPLIGVPIVLHNLIVYPIKPKVK